MRTFRFIKSIGVVLSVVIAVTLLGSLANAAPESSVPESELKAVHPNYLLPGINQACPRGTQKYFKVEFSVPKGEQIEEFGEFILLLKGGDQLTDVGYRVKGRLVEYYLYPLSRKAKVKLRDMRFNLAYAAYTSHDYTMVLSKDCVGIVP